jgi:hypothetical protein
MNFMRTTTEYITSDSCAYSAVCICNFVNSSTVVVQHDLRNAKHMPSRDKTCLLLVGETKVDLAELSANGSVISGGQKDCLTPNSGYTKRVTPLTWWILLSASISVASRATTWRFSAILVAVTDLGRGVIPRATRKSRLTVYNLANTIRTYLGS